MGYRYAWYYSYRYAWYLIIMYTRAKYYSKCRNRGKFGANWGKIGAKPLTFARCLWYNICTLLYSPVQQEYTTRRLE